MKNALYFISGVQCVGALNDIKPQTETLNSATSPRNTSTPFCHSQSHKPNRVAIRALPFLSWIILLPKSHKDKYTSAYSRALQREQRAARSARFLASANLLSTPPEYTFSLATKYLPRLRTLPHLYFAICRTPTNVSARTTRGFQSFPRKLAL